MIDSMVMTYDDIGRQIRQFQSRWNGDGQLQKIYSSARYISISLRSAGETTYLVFGRGKGFEGFWEATRQIPSGVRKKDRFLEYLRKHLCGARMLKLELDPEDRIIYLSYQKFGQELTLGLFYAGRKLYFANHHYDPAKELKRLFLSWDPKDSELRELPEAFKEVGRKTQDRQMQSRRIASIDELIAKEEKDAAELEISSTRKSKFWKRKEKNIEADLSKAMQWEELRDWVESFEAFEELGETVKIGDVKLRFRELTRYRRRNEVYEKIKKLQRGEQILRKRLEETRSEAASKEKMSEQNVFSNLEVIRPVWAENFDNKNKKDNVVAAGRGYSVSTTTSCELGIGEDARGNDQLRKEWAKKMDWWFHLDAESSPHIIVKSPSGSVTMEIIEEVARRMKAGAGLSGPEVNLVYTQVKNLKGIKGAPGAVTYKKEKRVRVNLPAERK